MRTRDADFVIKIIEATFVHVKGPKKGEPFLLEPWQKFICYNLAGFYYKGTNERRFKEAFIFLPRKNSKTFFASALAGQCPYWKGNIIRYCILSQVS